MGEDMRETAGCNASSRATRPGRARWRPVQSSASRARAITPNALTTAGVSLCLAAAVLVYFEDHERVLFYWLAAFVFVVGSILDILDGALARAGGKTTPFGSFLDSTTDRVGEGVDARRDRADLRAPRQRGRARATFAAVAGSFLVSYTRAKAEALGLTRRRRDRLASRAGRRDHGRARARTVGRAAVGDLPPAATAWLTVLQRILYVRKQLREQA